MAPPAPPGGRLGVPARSSGQTGSASDISSMGRSDSKRGGAPSASGAAGAAGATGRASFNRFSVFVKSGSENYVLGKLKANVQESDLIQVVVMEIIIVVVYVNLMQSCYFGDRKTETEATVG